MVMAQGTEILSGWNGHFPITRVALRSIRNRLEAGVGIEPYERLLLTACNFWEDANSRTLVTYVGSEASNRLRSAREAFSEIGADGIVRILRLAIDEIRFLRTKNQRQQYLAQVEDRVRMTDDAVDELIARFSWRRVPAKPWQAQRQQRSIAAAY